MDETDALLREIRIDWETLVTPDFNPLKQALRNRASSVEASNFRNLFHKVERVMEGIIEKSYKGFSDSVLSYMESYHLNRRCRDSIEEISRAVGELSGMRIDVKDMIREYDDVKVLEAKHGACLSLLEIRRRFAEFCEVRDRIDDDVRRGVLGHGIGSRLLEGAKQIAGIYELIDSTGVGDLECVRKFRDEVDSEAKDLMRIVYQRIDRFVFWNECEYQDDFRCVVVLDALQGLERHQADGLEKEYVRVVESTVEEVGRRTKAGVEEAVARVLMARSRAVVRNFQTLFEMADAAFEGLGERQGGVGEGDGALRLYTRDGRQAVESAINRVLRRFVADCLEGCEGRDSKEAFKAENFVDDIDYASVFEAKYLIHERVAYSAAHETGCSESFARVLPPSIETVIQMEKYAINGEMRKYLQGILSERYVKEKQSKVKKQVAYLLSTDEWHKSDHASARLSFYPGYQRAVADFCRHPELCNVSLVSDFLDELLARKFGGFFKAVFKSDIIRSSLEAGDKARVEASFKSLLLVRAIDRSSLFLQKQHYENVLFALETLQDANRAIEGKRLAEVQRSASMGMRLQVVLEVLYFFDLLYREGNHMGKSDYYLQRILKVVEDIYAPVSRLGVSGDYFVFVFECLNFYVRNNVSRLNVRSVRELRGFGEKIELLDEILGFIDVEGGLREAIGFVEDVVSGNASCESGKRLQDKLGGR